MAKPLGQALGNMLRTAEGRADGRRKLIMAIRAAARRHGLEDDDRRALQADLTGKASLADMTAGELGRVLDRLNRDWKRPDTARPHVAKVRALWWSLYWLGAISDPSDRALGAFAKRQAGVDKLTWLDHRRAPSVIEALKSWLEREGVLWPAIATGGGEGAIGERWAVLAAQAARLRTLAALPSGDPAAAARAALGGPIDDKPLTPRQLDLAIAALGKQLRRALLLDGELVDDRDAPVA